MAVYDCKLLKTLRKNKNKPYNITIVDDKKKPSLIRLVMVGKLNFGRRILTSPKTIEHLTGIPVGHVK